MAAPASITASASSATSSTDFGTLGFVSLRVAPLIAASMMTGAALCVSVGTKPSSLDYWSIQWTVTVSVSRPDRSTVPGRAPVASPSTTVSTPLTYTRSTPIDAATMRGAPSGQVAHERGRLAADRVGIEHDEIGERAFDERAAVAQPRTARAAFPVMAWTAHSSDTSCAAAQRVGEELRGIRAAAHAVEVRTGVAAAEEHVGVVPERAPQRPVGVVVVGRARPQHGAQVVGDHDVDQRVERVVVASLGGDVAHDASGSGPRSPR